MSGLAPFICGPCRVDLHTSCRGPEWACECPHVRALTPAPAPANPPVPLGVEAGAGGAVGDVGRGSGVPAAPPFPRPFWGEDGCRFTGRDDHVCRSSFGMPLEPGQVCFSEARASLRDELGERFVG